MSTRYGSFHLHLFPAQRIGVFRISKSYPYLIKRLFTHLHILIGSLVRIKLAIACYIVSPYNQETVPLGVIFSEESSKGVSGRGVSSELLNKILTRMFTFGGF